MKIYRLAWPEGFQFLTTRDISSQQALAAFGSEKSVGETNLRVELVTWNLGANLVFSDFPWLAPNAPAFSDRAVRALEDTLTRHGDIVPLQTKEGGQFYALDVRVQREIVDWQNAKVKRFRSGRVMTVEKYVFRPQGFEDFHIVKDAFDDAVGDVFVTQDYVDEVRATGLPGAEFELLASM